MSGIKSENDDGGCADRIEKVALALQKQPKKQNESDGERAQKRHRCARHDKIDEAQKQGDKDAGSEEYEAAQEPEGKRHQHSDVYSRYGEEMRGACAGEDGKMLRFKGGALPKDECPHKRSGTVRQSLRHFISQSISDV